MGKSLSSWVRWAQFSLYIIIATCMHHPGLRHRSYQTANWSDLWTPCLADHWTHHCNLVEFPVVQLGECLLYKPWTAEVTRVSSAKVNLSNIHEPALTWSSRSVSRSFCFPPVLSWQLFLVIAQRPTYSDNKISSFSMQILVPVNYLVVVVQHLYCIQTHHAVILGNPDC